MKSLSLTEVIDCMENIVNIPSMIDINEKCMPFSLSHGIQMILFRAFFIGGNAASGI